MTKTRHYLISFLWPAAGVLCWYLSLYIYRLVVSPVFMDTMRNFNASSQSILLKTFANMLYTHISAYLLGFLFALILSCFTDFTKPRLALFIIGAVITEVYGLINPAINFFRQYPAIPIWAVNWIIQSVISALAIFPATAFLGCLSGRAIKNRFKTQNQKVTPS